MNGSLTDDYLLQCEYAARRFQGAWTGTAGSLAAMLMHTLGEIQRLKVELALLEQRDDTSRAAG
jgi:hypothetical protein